jgi:2,4-dichlorophenol 6-monooxygenase
VIVDADADEEHFVRDRALYLQATTRPGAKLPHTWLVNRSGVRISTLDIAGKGKFSLWTGLSGQAWRGAAETLDAAWLRLIVVGECDTRDPYCHWAGVSEIAEAGAILVRPDGYVAWRKRSDVWDVEEATGLLQIALRTILDCGEI